MCHSSLSYCCQAVLTQRARLCNEHFHRNNNFFYNLPLVRLRLKRVSTISDSILVNEWAPKDFYGFPLRSALANGNGLSFPVHLLGEWKPVYEVNSAAFTAGSTAYEKMMLHSRRSNNGRKKISTGTNHRVATFKPDLSAHRWQLPFLRCEVIVATTIWCVHSLSPSLSLSSLFFFHIHDHDNPCDNEMSFFNFSVQCFLRLSVSRSLLLWAIVYHCKWIVEPVPRETIAFPCPDLAITFYAIRARVVVIGIALVLHGVWWWVWRYPCWLISLHCSQQGSSQPKSWKLCTPPSLVHDSWQCMKLFSAANCPTKLADVAFDLWPQHVRNPLLWDEMEVKSREAAKETAPNITNEGHTHSLSQCKPFFIHQQVNANRQPNQDLLHWRISS